MRLIAERFVFDVRRHFTARTAGLRRGAWGVAAAALRLPYYWFADHAMRSKYRIPHYLMGGLVRYRLSELSTWAARNAAAQSRFAGDTDTAVEEAE